MDGFSDPMQCARLAALEASLLAVLHAINEGGMQQADEITATIDREGLHLSFLSEGQEVGAISL